MNRSGRRDVGFATAELAASMPVLVVLLAVALTAVGAVEARVRAQDAARELARAAARGDTVTGRAIATADDPGAQLQVRTGATQVVATVSARVRALGGVVPAFTVTERCVAALEPGSGSGSGPGSGPDSGPDSGPGVRP